jgi:hypothetical protein
LGRVEIKGVSQEAEGGEARRTSATGFEGSHPGWADASLLGQPFLGEGRR